jgi:hypothetical protein
MGRAGPTWRCGLTNTSPTNRQTGPWHYVNIPPGATAYDRDRDCPRQPSVAAGSRADQWRDCVVDRIEYNRARVANVSLGRADRAIALKFLVNLVGDLHQPLHALSVARGGNDLPVVAFGSSSCTHSDGTSYPCNLHGVWDTSLIAHRRLTDGQYLDDLSRQIDQRGWLHSPRSRRWNGRWNPTRSRRRRSCLHKASSMTPTTAPTSASGRTPSAGWIAAGRVAEPKPGRAAATVIAGRGARRARPAALSRRSCCRTCSLVLGGTGGQCATATLGLMATVAMYFL